MSENEAGQLNEQAMDLYRQGHREEALEHFEMAAAAYARANDRIGQGEALNNLGVLYRLQRRHAHALQRLEQASAVLTEAGDNHRLGQVLGNMGDVYLAQKDCQQAFAAYSDAAQLLAEAGEAGKQADVLRAASLGQLRCRQWLSAIDLMRRSLQVRPRRSLSQQLLYLLFRLAGRIIRGPDPGGPDPE